jgi:low affinity Fe/Cu permease
MIAFAVAVLCVPVFDTLRVMGMRMANKKSPFHPDKTHLHHVFITVGVSHFITAMTEVLIMLTVVVIWWISVALGTSVEWQLYIVIIAAIIFVWGTYWIFNYHAQHHTKFLHFLVRFNVKTHLGRTSWWKRFTAWLDKPEDELVAKLETAANDSATIIAEEESIHLEDKKEQDRRKILSFMKGRAEVPVHDIVGYSGADSQNVFPILAEEEQKGRVRVIEKTETGDPDIVTLND